jgi:hypothetical protein
MVWNPYVGSDALFLAVALLAIGVLLIYFGMRLNDVIRIKRPGKVLSVFVMVNWTLCLATLLVSHRFISDLARPHPITPITILSGISTFIIIGYISRVHGLRVALGSAFVGTAAAPMIFELPFALIVMCRENAPVSVTLPFFLPLFLVVISTISLLSLSPLTSLSNYAFFSLGGMFIVFGVWAFFGFSYPSNPLSFSLNGISKVLSFTTAIMLFLKPSLTNQ